VNERTWTYQKLFVDAGGLHSTPDQVLVQHVGPASLALTEKGWIDGFFFLRYGEGGFHIRHRLRLTGVVDGATVGAYLHDAARHVDGIMRVEDAIYEREIVKYGGSQGIEICERVFCESSRLAISCIARTIGKPNLRLMVAVLVFDALLSAGEIRGAARAEVLAAYARYWEGLCGGRRGGSSYDPQPSAALVAMLAERLDKSNGRLGAVADLVGPPVGPWLSATTKHMSELNALARGGLLTTVTENIVCNLAHTTNNRLGMNLLDEVLIATLLQRADVLRQP
jgi:thiopeptide-type bacteriocin biosynthesis protein